MSRYIDVDALGIGKANPDIFIREEYASGWNLAIEIIENAPTADVAEVVRCKDCIFYAPYELEGCEGQGNCSQLIGLEFCVEDDFFVDTVQERTVRRNDT